MADGLMNNPFLGLLNMGLSPEQAQAQIDEQRAMQFANMNPQQRRAAGIYQGITGIGRALGARDPMLEQASQIRALQQQFDTQTAEGWKGFARALETINPSLAAQAGQTARQMEMQEAKLLSERALTQQRLREKEAADPIEKFILTNADKFTPASLQKFRETRKESDLVRFTAPEKEQLSGYGKILKDSGLEPGTPEFQKRMLDYAQAELSGASKRGSTTVNLTEKGRSIFIEDLAKADAATVKQARLKRDAAVSELETLGRALSLSNAPIVSGTAADLRVDALNFLDTIGVLGGKSKQQLVNSQQFQKETGDLVLAKIKQLGANPSNADREFVAKVVPNLTTSAEARRQLLEYLQKRAQDIVQETTRLEEYAIKNDGLRGFKPKIDLIKGGTGPGTTSKGTSYQVLDE